MFICALGMRKWGNINRMKIGVLEFGVVPALLAGFVSQL